MKKILFVLFVLVSVHWSQAQLLEKTKLGVRFGSDFRSFSVDDPTSGKMEVNGKTSYRAGINLDIPFGKHVLMEMGLYYAQVKGDVDISTKKSSYNPHTHSTIVTRTKSELEFKTNIVEFPLLLGYQFKCWKFGVQVKAGEYVNYAFGGKYKSAGKSSSNITGLHAFDHLSSKSKQEVDYDEVHENLDAGIQGEAGLVWKGIYLGFAYQAGLMNLEKEDQVPYENLKNRDFMIKLGYNF